MFYCHGLGGLSLGIVNKQTKRSRERYPGVKQYQKELIFDYQYF